MARVQCSLCSFEKQSLCTKKLRDGNPTSVKVNKKRTCSSYKEDSTRVLFDYRKKEAHKNVLKEQMQKRAYIEHAMRQMKEHADKSRTAAEEK